ncbi:MAG: hypothetical protein ACK5MU_04115 [Candidatus Saccharimonadales bacterium]
MKGEKRKLVKVNLRLFEQAKKFLKAGYSKKWVSSYLGVSKETLRSIDKAGDMREYREILDTYNAKRNARRKAKRELEKIIAESKYDRAEQTPKNLNRVQNPSLFIMLFVLSIIIIVCLIALFMCAISGEA